MKLKLKTAMEACKYRFMFLLKSQKGKGEGTVHMHIKAATEKLRNEKRKK